MRNKYFLNTPSLVYPDYKPRFLKYQHENPTILELIDKNFLNKKRSFTTLLVLASRKADANNHDFKSTISIPF